MKAAKKKAKDPTALYKPIKEHKVITAKYIGPPTGAQMRRARQCKHCKSRCKTKDCRQTFCNKWCADSKKKVAKKKVAKKNVAKKKVAKKKVAKKVANNAKAHKVNVVERSAPKGKTKALKANAVRDSVPKAKVEGSKAFIKRLKRQASKAKALKRKAAQQ